MAKYKGTVLLNDSRLIQVFWSAVDEAGQRTEVWRRLLRVLASETVEDIKKQEDRGRLEALERILEDYDPSTTAEEYDPTAPADAYSLDRDAVDDIMATQDPELNPRHVNSDEMTWPRSRADKTRILAAIERLQSRETDRVPDRGRIRQLVIDVFGDSEYYLESDPAGNNAGYPDRVWEYFEEHYEFDGVYTTREAVGERVADVIENERDNVLEAEHAAMMDDLSVAEAEDVADRARENMVDSWMAAADYLEYTDEYEREDIEEIITQAENVVDCVKQSELGTSTATA